MMQHIVPIPALIYCALFAAGASAMAAGIPTDKAELTQEITLRCIYDMGEFGNDGVQACIRADMAAAEALIGYPPEAKGIVDRCFNTLWSRGYGMVQMCVEQDLKAASALGAYAPEHADMIRSCHEKMGRQGAAKVKSCVDAALVEKPK